MLAQQQYVWVYSFSRTCEKRQIKFGSTQHNINCVSASGFSQRGKNHWELSPSDFPDIYK